MGLFALVACDPAASGPCASPSATLETTVTAGAMDPSALEACLDQDVEIEITAEVGGVFHVGGYEEVVDLVAGDTATMTFTADSAGQFLIHLHDEETGEETEVGVLTVHEP
jgi:hypothetical protein